MFGGIGLQQTALLYTNVANAAFLTAFYVPLVPLIAALFLGDTISHGSYAWAWVTTVTRGMVRSAQRTVLLLPISRTARRRGA